MDRLNTAFPGDEGDIGTWDCTGRERVAVFAGTREGRMLCQHLSEAGMAATAFVATHYGSAAFPDLPGIQVSAGRLTEADMEAALKGFDTVVDATHPYAVEVSKQLKRIGERTGFRLLRLIRPETPAEQPVTRVPDAQSAAAFLAQTEGKILLTTGSKELAAYTSLPDYQNRLYLRVLPDPEVLRHCIDLGFPPSHLIAMQGPFSHSLNVALLEDTGAEWLVTKDTGSAGGLPEKLSAAQQVGVKVLMLSRPTKEAGYSLEQLCQMLGPVDIK